MSGAVPPPVARLLGPAAKVPRPVCPGCGRCGCGDPAPAPQCAPMRAGVARCAGGGRASPGGVPFTVVRGVCGQALPLSRLPALRAGCLGPPPTCCGRGCADVGALHCPLGLHALWGLRAAGPAGGRLRGGGLPPLWGASGVRRCSPPAARSLGRAAGVPRPVCPGCGLCGRGDPAAVPQRAPLRVSVARRGGGRRASPGGAYRRCEGRLRSGAPPPPTARPLGELSGSVTHVLWARVCGCRGPTLSPWLACPVGAAYRGGGGLPPL